MSMSAISQAEPVEYGNVIPAYLLQKRDFSRKSHFHAEELNPGGKGLVEDLANTLPSEGPPPLPVHCQPRILNNSVGGMQPNLLFFRLKTSSRDCRID